METALDTAPAPNGADAEHLAAQIAGGVLVGAAALAAAYGLYRLTRRIAGGRQPMIHFLSDLGHAPFPAQSGPDAAVAVPSRFDPTQPLRLCVYFRGFSSCVTSIIGDREVACSPGGPRRGFSALGNQLEASGANLILVLPELRREAQSGDPGALRNAGAFDAMMNEILGRLEPLVPGLGRRSMSDVARLGVMSHSGGYQAVAQVVRAAPPSLRSVALLDSLYGEDSKFAAWISAHATGFAPGGDYRFADIYTTGGGTADHSRALYDRVLPTLRAAGAGARVMHDTTSATLDPEAYLAHPVLFKFSALSHGGVSRYYPQRLWSAGW